LIICIKNIGYAVGGLDGHVLSNGISYSAGSSGIMKTTNAGVNWSTLPSDQIKNILRSIYFIGNTGFAVGDNGTIIKIINNEK
jgi:photosystem II stability/assembly factor-like uncharacterized protein